MALRDGHQARPDRRAPGPVVARLMSLGEVASLRAVARAQRQVGFSISTHTTHYGELAFEQIAVFREEGVPMERVVIGHLGEYAGAADVCGNCTKPASTSRSTTWDGRRPAE